MNIFKKLFIKKIVFFAKRSKQLPIAIEVFIVKLDTNTLKDLKWLFRKILFQMLQKFL